MAGAAGRVAGSRRPRAPRSRACFAAGRAGDHAAGLRGRDPPEPGLAAVPGHPGRPFRRDGPRPRPGRVRRPGRDLPGEPRQQPHHAAGAAPHRGHPGRQGRPGRRHHHRRLPGAAATRRGPAAQQRCHQPVLLPAAAGCGHLRRYRPARAGTEDPGPAQLRAADRPLRHHLPPGPGPAGGLPARTPARRRLPHLAQALVLPGPAVLARPGASPPGHRLAAPARRGGRRVEAADHHQDDQDPHRWRRGHRGHRAPPQRL